MSISSIFIDEDEMHEKNIEQARKRLTQHAQDIQRESVRRERGSKMKKPRATSTRQSPKRSSPKSPKK